MPAAKGFNMIYYVEDDDNIRDLTVYALRKQGIEAEGFSCDGEFKAAVARRVPDAVLLDIMLPVMDGWQVCRELRKTMKMPIIMLTAKGETIEKVAGLEMGADDYIAKPFSIREVLARVRSVLRRTAQPAAEEKAVAFEGLRMDLTRKVCTIDGEPLALTKKEFEILALLLSSRGKIFSREEILRQVWSDEVIVLDRTIDVNITRLRRKIGPYGEHIVTRLGYGYGFEE